MALPPKYRLVIQGQGDESVPYLLELRRVRYFLDGSFVPVWLAPSRPALQAYPPIEYTVRPNPGHYFRLMTGTEPREQRMSESLNFRGMWPQEIYVYIREFQHQLRDYVHNTFIAQMEHEARNRQRSREDMENRRKLREAKRVEVNKRNRQIVDRWKSGQKQFGIAVDLKVSLATVRNAINFHKRLEAQ